MHQSTSNQSSSSHMLQTWHIILLSLVGLVLFVILAPMVGQVWNEWNAGVDYNWTYYPVPRDLVIGEHILYLNDGTQPNFFLLTWGVVFLVALSTLPYETGLGILVLGTIILAVMILLFYTPEDRKKPWAVALAIFNLHVFDLIFRAQVDIFVAVGIFLGWLGYRQNNPWLVGVGCSLMIFFKPPNALGVAALLYLLVWYKWGWYSLLQALFGAVAAVVVSTLIDPLALVRYITTASPPSLVEAWKTTIWRMQQVLDLPLIIPILIVLLVAAALAVASRWALQIENADIKLSAAIMLVLTATFLVTPYSLSYHFVTLLIFVFPVLFVWRPTLGVLLYALTFLPLLRIFIGVENAWIDIFFVLALFAATIGYTWAQTQPDEAEQAVQPA